MPSPIKISEHQFQVQLCELLKKTAKPTVCWFAIGNGGKRSISVARKLKAEGVMAGVADMCFMLPEGQTAWLELKAKRGSLSPEQRQFHNRCDALGHPWAMARTMDQAFAFLRDVGVLKDGVELC